MEPITLLILIGASVVAGTFVAFWVIRFVSNYLDDWERKRQIEAWKSQD